MGSMTLANLVRTYICAKDSNRPHLVPRVFSPTASVEMVVKTDAIAFDPEARGPEAIAEMLVRRFAQQYDNIYTFCLCEPPPPAALRLDCGWLVMMSDKETRELRAGFGRYAWEWRPDVEPLVQRLTITIERMDRFDPALCAAAFEWAERLPYPWCPVGRAAGAPTPLDAVIYEAAARTRTTAEPTRPHTGSIADQVTLREITAETVRAVTKLAVTEYQNRFVAPNAVSLAQAPFAPGAWHRAIYLAEEPVGFVMLSDESLLDPVPENPEVGVWRFMVDAKHQRVGVGRAAMLLVIEHVRRKGLFKKLTISYIPEEGGPEQLYLSLGFRPTGEMDEDEVVMELQLSASASASAA